MHEREAVAPYAKTGLAWTVFAAGVLATAFATFQVGQDAEQDALVPLYEMYEMYETRISHREASDTTNLHRRRRGLIRGSIRGVIPLAEHAVGAILAEMKRDVEYTEDFGEWRAGWSEDEPESPGAPVRLLEDRGPNLGFPHSSGVHGSRRSHIEAMGGQLEVVARFPDGAVKIRTFPVRVAMRRHKPPGQVMLAVRTAGDGHGAAVAGCAEGAQGEGRIAWNTHSTDAATHL